MKQLIIILLAFLSNTASGQEKQGIAKYALIEDYSNLGESMLDTIQDESIKKIILAMREQSTNYDTIYFNLRFKSNISYFKSEEEVVPDGLNIYEIVASTMGEFYVDVEGGTSISLHELDGVYFRIEDDLFNVKWELTDEKRNINGYDCNKAITSYTETREDGTERTYPIVAWYKDGFLEGHGPKGYGGLPGLIVELEFNPVTSFKLVSIDLEEEVSIDKPTKGKKVTIDEYNAYVREN